MAVAKQDLPSIHRGDSRTYEVTFTDENGAPVDISDTVLWLTIKLDPTDADPGAAQVKTTFPNDATSQAGKGYITLTKEATVNLTPDTKYYYDFQWVYNAGVDVQTMGWGGIKILQDVTHDIV